MFTGGVRISNKLQDIRSKRLSEVTTLDLTWLYHRIDELEEENKQLKVDEQDEEKLKLIKRNKEIDKMSNPITPNWRDLIDKSDDELREILSELNNQSLRKLTRETIQALFEHRNHIEYEKEEREKLYNQLNKIAELAQKR